MSKTGKRARVIALYLPQYHPIPENDEWWGPGFTEWTNVAKAKPMFRGHYQPHIPADLGFYDLRVPETRVAQAEMARANGVEAFCYWHYWFAGRRILERPFQEVLSSKEPDFPFCLGWANETWSGIWHGNPDRVLIEQTYPGPEDYTAHFRAVVAAFSDPRYLKIEGKPLFHVQKPKKIPDPRQFTDLWRELAREVGFPGLYLVADADESWNPRQCGFDAALNMHLPKSQSWEAWPGPLRRLRREWNRLAGWPKIHRHELIWEQFLAQGRSVSPHITRHVSVLPNWDNTPRSGVNGVVVLGSNPELFRQQVRKALAMVAGEPLERRLVFVKSWNEWAEGNHLEPDLRFGRGYLEVLRDEVCASGDSAPGTLPI
jgi:lipopolysaccharide biosynthesis protein